MRKLVLAMVLVVAFAGLTMAQVLNSSHDLSIGSGGPSQSNTEQMCVFCHTPHDAIVVGTVVAPLWNHELPTAAVTYPIYGQAESATMSVSPAALSAAAPTVSILCMSCHEGTIAVSSLFNDPNDIGVDPTMVPGANMTAGGLLQNSPALGNDLTNDHPVNFNYELLAIAEPTAFQPVTPGAPNTVVNGAITLPLFAEGTGGGNPDMGIQCATCHDPHDGPNDFMRGSMADSALCTACHIDK